MAQFSARPTSSPARAPHRPHEPALAMGLLLSALLSACGGGGGSDTSSAPGETPQNTVTPPALNTGPDAFHFAPSAATAAPGVLDTVAGGTELLAAWNPNNGDTVLSPGMKVMFFGRAEGCAAGSQGPLTTPSGDRLSQVQTLTGMSARASAGMRWVASANTSVCDEQVRAKRGASAVFVNADDTDGGVGILTSSGVQADGSRSFLGPYASTGQNGKGDNAYITGTFVNFRHAGWSSDPLQPWLNGTKARLRSVQGIATAKVEGSSADVVQVKQQMMATFYNNQCRVDQPGKPCQIQYLMNTAILRSGVTDWSTQGWYQNAKVWFDPVQGGIPIVSGPIESSGVTTTDSEFAMSIWSSQGSASQHGNFAPRAFDVTVSFDQLLNVVRITTARFVNKAPTAVTAADMVAVWGSDWNSPQAWSVLSVDVGQEVYNPDSAFRAEIGGGFKDLYVGPQ